MKSIRPKRRATSCMNFMTRKSSPKLGSGCRWGRWPDSACHESRLVNWLRDEKREGWPQGEICLANSARMSEGLRAAVLAVPAEAWQTNGEDAEVIRECAEVAYVPSEKTEKKDQQPLRYVGMRLRRRQGKLFADGSTTKHYAVVSNIWKWSAPRLLEWHREKTSTIEMVHEVIKSELAAGVLPCGRFGANAAWLRLAVLTHNIDDGVGAAGAAARTDVDAHQAIAVSDF